MAPDLEADDADVILPAVDFDEAQVRRLPGKLLRPCESAVADHNDSVRALPFEKGMSKEDGFFDSAAGVRRDQIAYSLPEPSLVGRERNNKTALRPGSDDHHLLARCHLVDQ